MEHITIEFSSATRNRSSFSNPFQFEVTLNNTGQSRDGLDAKDPISNQLPINLGKVPLCNNDILLEWTCLEVDISGEALLVSYNEALVAGQNFSKEYNFYRGLSGKLTLDKRDVFSHIIEYIYMGTDNERDIGLFRFDALPSAFDVKDKLTVTFKNLSPQTGLRIVFIPKTTSHDNLSNMYLCNDSKNEYEPILSYSASRGEAILNSENTQSWTTDDTFSVRTNVPLVGNVVFGEATSAGLSLGSASSILEAGDFVRHKSSKGIFTVTNVTRAEQQININFFPLANPVWKTKDVLEILKFSQDNFCFMSFGSLQREAPYIDYEATLISLSLPNEQLKNTFPGAFSSGAPTRVETVPFVYLELRDTLHPATNSFMSNNPGSRRALFKATQTDSSESKKPFIKFTGDSVTQTLKFRPSAANFLFSILSPVGSVLEMQREDTKSPFPPCNTLQVEALISIRARSDKGEGLDWIIGI